MRSKIVLWGANAQDEKILIGIELRSKDSIVEIHQFSETQATEEFYNELLHKWRIGEKVEFPKEYIKVERPLSMTESILPEDIKVDRTDVIQRAQAEWHFVVLADKLYEMYRGELDELKEKAANLKDYDRSIWNDLKGFWKKVQEQSRSKALFHKHANELRNETNELFGKLKNLRKVLDEEFSNKSKSVKEEFDEMLNDIEKRIDKGLGLKPIFDDLKKVQQKFKNHKFIRKDRESIWNRIDKSFKSVKAKRFGDKDGDDSKLSRLQKRYDGMLAAVERMERSIKRDKKDIEFQKMKIGSTDGQLEAQIRAAKLKMLEDRIASKDIKYQDMIQTKQKLELGLQKEKDHIEMMAKKEAAKKEAAEKIQKEMEKKSIHSAEEEAKLKDAAEKIKEAATARKAKKKAPKKEKLMDAIGATLGESLGDVVDTIKAVAEVVSERMEDVVDDVVDKMSDIIEDVAETVSDVVEDIKGDKEEE